SNRIAAIRSFSRLLQQSAQECQIVLVELGVNRPRSLVGWDGILLLPSAAGVLVKVDARVDRLVHGADIEAWAVGEDGFFRGGSRRMAVRIRACILSDSDIAATDKDQGNRGDA